MVRRRRLPNCTLRSRAWSKTAALLGAMRGTSWLMTALIYGGGLRVSECCELRVKDIDFDQGLVFVRSGKGDKDRSTLLAEVGREELRAQLRRSEALHRADRESDLAGVWLPDALDRKYPNAGRELGWFEAAWAGDPRSPARLQGLESAGHRFTSDRRLRHLPWPSCASVAASTDESARRARCPPGSRIAQWPPPRSAGAVQARPPRGD